jgi:hypothetical protein
MSEETNKPKAPEHGNKPDFGGKSPFGEKPDTDKPEDSEGKPDFDKSSDKSHGGKKSDGDKPGFDKKSDNDDEIGSGPSSLIGGGGLLGIIGNIISTLQSIGGGHQEGSGVELSDGKGHDSNSLSVGLPVQGPPKVEHAADFGMSPFDVLEDADFDGDDPTVQQFKKDTGGCKGVVKIIRLDGPQALEKLSQLMESLHDTRTATRLATMRTVFSAVSSARNGVDGGRNQALAVGALDWLIADSSEAKERTALAKARECVLQGTASFYDAATFRVRGAFASTMPASNIRLAYTSLVTQDGEGYQLCPKAAVQIGHAIPMELSKCRDNCIDSRTTREGKITCAYSQWLKVSADSQDALNARLDVQRHPDNAANLLSLAAGQRSHPAHDKADHDGFESRLDDAPVKRNTEKFLGCDDNMEARLDSKQMAGGTRRPSAPKEEPKSVSQELSKKAASDAKRITPDSDDTLGRQVEKGNSPKDVPKKVQENQLEEGENGREGDPEESYPQMLNKKPSSRTSAKPARIDPSKPDTMGEQISQGNRGEVEDESIAQMLASQDCGLSEEDLDKVMEIWLIDLRKNQDK